MRSYKERAVPRNGHQDGFHVLNVEPKAIKVWRACRRSLFWFLGGLAFLSLVLWLAVLVGPQPEGVAAQGPDEPTPTVTPTLVPTPPSGPQVAPKAAPPVAPLAAPQGWEEPVPVADTGYESRDPDLFADPNGLIHVIWAEWDASPGSILYSRWDGVTWSDPFTVTTGVTEPRYPDIVTDSQGELHVVWQAMQSSQPYVFYSSSQDDGVSWTTPLQLSSAPATGPRLAVDSADTLYAVWQQWPRIYWTRNEGSGWFTPASAPPAGDDGPFSQATATDGSNNLHLTWTAIENNYWIVYHSRWNDQEGWLARARVSPWIQDHADLPAVNTDSDNRPHVAWYEDDNEVFYTIARGEESETNLSNDPDNYSGYPDIVVDANDMPHVVWYDAREGDWQHNQILYTHQAGWDSWTSPVNLSQTSENAVMPAIAVGPDGQIHVVWMDSRSGVSNVYYTVRYALEPEGVWVNVSVSTTSLDINGEGWPEPNPVEVTVQAGNNTTTTVENAAILFTLNSTDSLARFYVLEENGHGEGSYEEADQYVENYPGEFTLTLAPGESISITWQAWVQPSEATTLSVSAQLVRWVSELLAEDSATVDIPLAQMHPLILIPGITTTLPPSEKTWQGQIDPIVGIYRPLMANLEKMGYEKWATFHPMPYDWRQSNRVSADRLDELIGEVLTQTVDVPYIAHDGKVDVLVHSMGGIVTRAYVQGAGEDDENGNAPIVYNHDIRKVIFVATPHRGFPVTYKTWEGLNWDDYLYGDDEGHLRLLFNEVLWPSWIFKKYDPSPQEILEGCIWLPGFVRCPKTTLHQWSHHPERGILSLAEMLPTEDVPDYLCRNLNPDGGCVSGDSYPYGHEPNPLMNDLNANVQALADALGPENIYVIYGTGSDTDYWYEVESPEPVLWAHGKPTTLDVKNDDDFETDQGDDLIPTYSNNLGYLLSDIPEDNVIEIARPEVGHKEVIYYEPTLRVHLPRFLIGQTVPFTTPYEKPTLIVDPGQWFILTGLCPVNLTVTDPQGRRVGYDPATGGVVDEIPDAVYASPDVEGQFIIVPRAPAGEYQLAGTGFEDGEYTLLPYRIDDGGAWPLGVFSGTVAVGQTVTFTLDYAPSIFADSFDRPDSTDLGPDWVEELGDWDIADGQLHVLANDYRAVGTSETFTQTQYTIETRFWASAEGMVGPADASLRFTFGTDTVGSAFSGYSVAYYPLLGKLKLRRDGNILDHESLVLETERWYGLLIERDGGTGQIRVYLDQGEGYPSTPTLEAVDGAYPELRRLGMVTWGSGYGLYVDWVTAMPWEGEP